ncbi:hypothetical protein D9V34_00770 [Mycetocola lacteus]|uniref:DUF600 family protein n=1 Tax=Mycetocola lacteus TaxID=76637 RepID=A0A3L7AXD5_9MICO|nr:hypothetical protein [Mycetocola lacteus]RLP80780.1 hypothetical protein D9V34_13065 [Mycetocola lacteus]RLP84565.1 hypothetical protein D9V34_00770 [Mycetocola lacteus]
MNVELADEHVALTNLNRQLAQQLRPGDTRIELLTSVLRGGSRARVRIYNASGNLVSPPSSERYYSGEFTWDLGIAIDKLRAACYREGAGTWFSATITVTEQGTTNAEYNYDNEPEWDTPIDPAAYVEDQEFFPRDLSAQPQWLRQRLAEGQARIDASGNKRRRR